MEAGMNYQKARDSEQLRFLDKSIDKFIDELRPAESRRPSGAGDRALPAPPERPDEGVRERPTPEHRQLGRCAKEVGRGQTLSDFSRRKSKEGGPTGSPFFVSEA